MPYRPGDRETRVPEAHRLSLAPRLPRFGSPGFLVGVLLVLSLAVTACASNWVPESSGEPARSSIRASIPSATPRGMGGFDARRAWLYGTPTPSGTPTSTGTPGPSVTPTLTPTPINAETLKGQLLFISSRRLPPTYAPPAPSGNLKFISPDLFKSLQGNSGAPVWKFDPTNSKVEPCDPPPGTPTPFAPGTPAPLLFSDLGQIFQRVADACAQVYADAHASQTWSPDKRFETYVGADPNGGRPQIWAIDHQDNTKKMLTRFGSGVSYDPVFSPDGDWIAFISQERAGVDNLYIITRDGTDLQRLTRLPGQAWPTTWEWVKRPTWSADGTQIAFWSNKVNGARQIWVMNRDGANLRTISNDPRPAEDYDPVWVR